MSNAYCLLPSNTLQTIGKVLIRTSSLSNIHLVRSDIDYFARTFSPSNFIFFALSLQRTDVWNFAEEISGNMRMTRFETEPRASLPDAGVTV